MFKKIVIIFVIVIVLISVALYYNQGKIKEEKIYHILDQLTLALSSELKSRQMDDLEMALFLSKNASKL